MFHDLLRPTKVDVENHMALHKVLKCPLKQLDDAAVNVLDRDSCSVSLCSHFFQQTQPESIGHLVGLKDLWLDGNQLTEVPAVSRLCSLPPPFLNFHLNSTKSAFVIFLINILKRWRHICCFLNFRKWAAWEVCCVWTYLKTKSKDFQRSWAVCCPSQTYWFLRTSLRLCQKTSVSVPVRSHLNCILGC